MAHTGTVHRPTSRRRRIAVVAVVLALIAASVSTAAVLLSPANDFSMDASSSASGSDLEALVNGEGSGTHWRSEGQATGAWIQISWPKPRDLDRVQLVGNGSRTFTAARATFSDGSALMVAPDVSGKVDVSFPQRRVSSARVTFVGVPSGVNSVALSTFLVSNSGTAVSTDSVPSLSATASSSAPDHPAGYLIDGEPANGDLGREWSAAPGASSGRATVRWSSPREIAAVRLWGPTASAYDPAYSAAAALNGRIRFPDGTSVRISGIAGGAGQPTTIAFTPRIASSIAIDLQRTIPQATIGLRGVQILPADSPPSPVSGSPASLLPATPMSDATECTPGPAAPARAVSGPAPIALVCPSAGTSVQGRTMIVVEATPGSILTASTERDPQQPGTSSQVGTATAGSDGRASIPVDMADLPNGPIGVQVRDATNPSARSLNVQLLNSGGSPAAGKSAPSFAGGRALVWDDEFDQAPSISDTGADATYAARKPEYWGGAQFGDAAFDSPGSPARTFAWVDGKYLRIRAQPTATGQSSGSAKYLGGLLSSLHVGASGFSAQYGYYEIRMLAPAAHGTWPAFWAMNTDAATRASEESSAEADAVELYGNDPSQSCHSVHSYTNKTDKGKTRCVDGPDLSTGWHTFGMQIEPGGAEFFVDGKRVHTETGLSHTDEPFYFMVDLALGGGWPVDLAPTGGVADLWIDYIRVYV